MITLGIYLGQIGGNAAAGAITVNSLTSYLNPASGMVFFRLV
jgi:hypothetical protein